jgi:hypothetical protein
MHCPRCHSDNTQLACLIYAEGTQHASSSSKTVFGSVHASSTAQTPLAAMCAPPEPLSVAMPDKIAGIFITPPILMLFFFSWFGGFSKGLLLASLWLLLVLSPIWGVAMFISFRRKRHNKTVMPARLEQWQRSWFCKKCATRFYV